jgi:hypothetical protein
MKPVVIVPKSLVDECLWYGERIVADYAANSAGRARELALDYRGISKSPGAQATAKAAECAFCVYMGLDPHTAVDWSVDHADDGGDIAFKGHRVDVKTTVRRGQYLIWPKTKNHLFAGKRFSVLALVKGDAVAAGKDAEFEMTGWMLKSDFAAQRKTASAGHKLDEGTWHVHQSALQDFRARPRRAPCNVL